MKLYAYEVRTNVTVGDAGSYSITDLGDTEAFKYGANLEPAPIGYLERSTILFWGLHGLESGAPYSTVRDEVIALTQTKGYGNATDAEKAIFDKFNDSVHGGVTHDETIISSPTKHWRLTVNDSGSVVMVEIT